VKTILFLPFTSVRKSVGQPGGLQVIRLKMVKLAETDNTT